MQLSSRNRLQIRFFRSSEWIEIAHDTVQPILPSFDYLKVLIFRRAGAMAALKTEQPDCDGRKWIANFVSDARGEHAERREFFLPFDNRAAFGEIAAQRSNHPPINQSQHYCAGDHQSYERQKQK